MTSRTGEPQRYIATLVCSTDKSMASGGAFSGGAEFSGGQVAGGGHGLQYPQDS